MRLLSLFLLFCFSITSLSCFAETKLEKVNHPVVIMKTNIGELEIELYPQEAPITVKNFLRYVDEGFYKGTVFHRVIPGFVVQGGGFTQDMQKKPTHPDIKNESRNGLKNLRGTLSMARLPSPHSATSQFFINLNYNNSLDARGGRYGYAVFAKVIKGMEVVDKMAGIPTKTLGKRPPIYKDVPSRPIIIESISRKTAATKL